jgi:hypothetical protein
MEQNDYWHPNSLNFSSFSTSYARQPDEAMPVFGPASVAHSARPGVSPATRPAPLLQDDARLIGLGNFDSSLTPEFEKSHCQRILFVWAVVFKLCKANHDLALLTWRELLDGEGEDDIWLWADGDEKDIRSSYNLCSDSPSSRWSNNGGWKLTNSDLHMGISALARRVDRAKGGVSEGLNITESRKRLHPVAPTLRFAVIALSIFASEAMRRADTSRGIAERSVCRARFDLDLVLRINQDVRAFIHGKFLGYRDSMKEVGPKCPSRSCSLSFARDTPSLELWTYYVTSLALWPLVILNHDVDRNLLRSACRCPDFEARFRYRSPIP